MKRIPILLIVLFIFACKENKIEVSTTKETPKKNSLIFPEETHFKSLRQVTFGGDNAEAYWSFDDRQLIFQSNNKKWGLSCDQMFLMNADETFNKNIPPMIEMIGRILCIFGK